LQTATSQHTDQSLQKSLPFPDRQKKFPFTSFFYFLTDSQTNSDSRRQRTTAYNSRFAKAGVSCFYDSEVLNSSIVHLMKFSAENPRLRKAAKR
jgi:hypothetical protein